MKAWKLLLPVPLAAALLAMVPQDPRPEAPADEQGLAMVFTGRRHFRH